MLAALGVAVLCSPAEAQDSAAEIEARIESVFKVVPGNPLDLAVPLSRRALARRLGEGAVAPLPFAETGPAEVVSEANPDIVEEGSADAEGDADEDLARLPRPRPGSEAEGAASVERLEIAAAASDRDAGEASAGSGSPPDLVAGAAEPEATPAEPAVPAADPPGETVLAAAAQPPAVPAPEDVAQRGDPPVPVKRDLVAREACLDLAKVADRDDDFERNAEAIAAGGFCVAQERFRERKRPWTVQTVSSGRPGPLWAVMHDDEDVAFDMAIKALAAYGGTLFTVETGGRRNQDGIDPNRNFSDDEISCKKLGPSAAPRFTAAFEKLIDPAQPIIALHNNSDRHVPTGGLGHVSMRTVPKDMRKAPAEDQDGPLAGEHALVLLVATEPVGEAAERRMADLNRQGINAVLEPVAKGRGDCSLSNFAALSGHEDYFNVTVDHDEGDKMLRIVEAILADPARLADSR